MRSRSPSGGSRRYRTPYPRPQLRPGCRHRIVTVGPGCSSVTVTVGPGRASVTVTVGCGAGTLTVTVGAGLPPCRRLVEPRTDGTVIATISASPMAAATASNTLDRRFCTFLRCLRLGRGARGVITPLMVVLGTTSGRGTAIGQAQRPLGNPRCLLPALASPRAEQLAGEAGGTCASPGRARPSRGREEPGRIGPRAGPRRKPRQSHLHNQNQRPGGMKGSARRRRVGDQTGLFHAPCPQRTRHPAQQICGADDPCITGSGARRRTRM